MTPKQAIEAARAHPLAYYAARVGKPIGAMHRRLAGSLLTPADTYQEMARGHGKTSGVSIVLEWLLGHYPSLRVKVISSTDEEAIKTTEALREPIQSDLFLHLLS